ncbi:MAG: hypothetical protein Q8Q09_24150 [Deltaproteobacteria bacterium]|nr:hypothetical protein [Deltaproteobacteria bacterium]
MAERALDRFLRTFVTPLAHGGKVEVDGLLGPGALDEMISRSGLSFSHVDGKVMSDAVSAVRAQLTPLGPATDFVTLTPDAVALGVAWYNLLAMTHPEVVKSDRLRRTTRTWILGMLEWVGPPQTAAEVAMRHGLCAGLSTLGRVDTQVTFWAGSAQYIGINPPNRLVAWKSLRNVQEVRTRHDLLDLLAPLAHPLPECDLLPLAVHALALSPLTDLALCDRLDQPVPFRWTSPMISMLVDAPLRGAAVRIALGPGARGAEALAKRITRLETATVQASYHGLTLAAAEMLIAFHLELLVFEALARESVPAMPLAVDLVLRLGVPRASQMCGLSPETFTRALAIGERTQPPAPGGPASTLLAVARIAEVSS